MVLKILVFGSAHNYCVCIDFFFSFIFKYNHVLGFPLIFLGSQLSKQFTYAYSSYCILAFSLFDFLVQFVGLFKNMEFLRLPC